MKYKVGPATSERHPSDVYTPEMHAANLELAENTLERYGHEDGGKIVTPWLEGKLGLVALERDKENKSTIRMIETRAEGFYGLGAHFVDEKVVLRPDSLKTKSKIWPPFHQRMGILFMNTPISAGMLMGYPSLERSLTRTNRRIDEALSDPTLEKVHPYNLSGLFAERPIDLRFRVGVKL